MCRRTSGNCAEKWKDYYALVFCVDENGRNDLRVFYLCVALPQAANQFITLICVQVRWKVRVHAELRANKITATHKQQSTDCWLTLVNAEKDICRCFMCICIKCPEQSRCSSGSRTPRWPSWTNFAIKNYQQSEINLSFIFKVNINTNSNRVL